MASSGVTLVSFCFIAVSFQLVPLYSGTILVHFVSFRRHSASFRYIPVYSVPFHSVPVFSNARFSRPYSCSFQSHSGSFQYISVSFRLAPVHSGSILVHSLSFRCHSASFRYIPAHSGIFRSVPVFSNAHWKTCWLSSLLITRRSKWLVADGFQ